MTHRRQGGRGGSGGAVVRVAAAASRLEMLRGGVRLRRRPGLGAAARERLLEAVLEADGLRGACAVTGLGFGAVLAERARNPGFRRRLTQALEARREMLELLLVDQAVRGLMADGAAAPGEAREKQLTALAQALVARADRGEGAPAPTRRRAGAGGRARAGAGSGADPWPLPAVREAAALPTDPADLVDPDELERLADEVERRVAAAEAALGLTPFAAGGQ